MESRGELSDLAETVVAQLRLSDGATPFHVVVEPQVVNVYQHTRRLHVEIRPRRADGKLCWDVFAGSCPPFSSRDAEFVAALAIDFVRASANGMNVYMYNDKSSVLPLYTDPADDVKVRKLVKTLWSVAGATVPPQPPK